MGVFTDAPQSGVFSRAQQLQVTAVSLATVHLWAPAVPMHAARAMLVTQEPCSAHLRPHRGCVPGTAGLLPPPAGDSRSDRTFNSASRGLAQSWCQHVWGRRAHAPCATPWLGPWSRGRFPAHSQDQAGQPTAGAWQTDRQTSVGTSAQAPPHFSHCTAATCCAIHCLLFAPWE